MYALNVLKYVSMGLHPLISLLGLGAAFSSGLVTSAMSFALVDALLGCVLYVNDVLFWGPCFPLVSPTVTSCRDALLWRPCFPLVSQTVTSICDCAFLALMLKIGVCLFICFHIFGWWMRVYMMAYDESGHILILLLSAIRTHVEFRYRFEQD